MLTLKNRLVPYFKASNPDEAYTLPAEIYVDADFLKIECQTVFENSWQLIGHVNQLENAGDQILAQVGRVPIVIVRTRNMELKAFHNVCRHRAGPVAIENGNDKVLRCKYHGWTYNLDGELLSAPEMNSTPNFDICQHHLPQTKLEEWQGFIFACISDKPPALAEVFEAIVDTINPISLTEMFFSHRDEYLIECNWKVYMDNYLEGYHLPHVHPGLNQLLDYRQYNTEIKPWYSYQHSPLEKVENIDNFYGAGKAHYYCVYPNLMLNILQGRLQTNVILPVDHQRTRVIFDYYYSNPGSEITDKLIAKDRAFSDEIQDEDIAICEKVQRGLNSGSYHVGRLCMKRESAVLHFQDLIRASVREHIQANKIDCCD